ncbi:pyridine nucleotide-disulfide oxidoreductase domain-containing protein [Trichoderma breve]|uniref:Pyridine nucleotide-disulfide oxidoreductase domain-containing protein n=1 Tax=Trichoderma breve TaxID=2034170 RepID=A0A9W9EEW5_9HYPO|nr:pyridine nucleotide-disulfide oxidoreductase domain-containing protein [Trichoderma breve]KAJ4865404.1 pyridine nucleotide-disulfide oxidoreductase domain-containing protein [Trichoderma breve]
MGSAQLHGQLPTWERSAPGSINISPAVFPKSALTPASDLDANKTTGDLLFVDQGFWRDHLALTWEFRTAQGPQEILSLLETSSKSRDGFRLKNVTPDTSSALRAPRVGPLDGEGEVIGITFFFNFDTVIGSGKGVGRIINDNGTWKFYSLYTALQELKDYKETINERRPHGVEHGAKQGRQNWAQRREQEKLHKNANPAVVIIGAGQSGLTIAARLKMMGVEALVIDESARVGDSWRKRYHQLVLHDPVWYDHMPYLPFPPHWPIFTPKDKLAEFFEAYVTLLELNVWNNTSIGGASWDATKGGWDVKLLRRLEDGSVETHNLRPRHIIQATGHSGFKYVPQFKGMDTFKGDRICHSSEFPGARENSKGKKAVVVGSCNSAHDIAQDFVEKGYDVTMVQRSSTFVTKSESITGIVLAAYSENGPPVEDVDLLIHSASMALLKTYQISTARRQAENDRDILEGLLRVGFKVDTGPDGAGLFYKYFQWGGGYYIDVGASQLIIDGKIKMKSGQEVSEVLPHGLRFADGSELEADEIILATGYGNMRDKTRVMLGDAVADKVNDVWGIGAGGELRSIWQQSGHPGFWIHGGNLALCRYYSKLLALQIKGIEAGLYGYGEN